MPKTSVDHKTFAYNAASEVASRGAVGAFIDSINEDEGVVTYFFESKLKGYVGWRWSVSVYQGEDNTPATISETLLIPGPDSLVAPNWVPWSERLADYKALQVELEAQAASEVEGDEDDEEQDESFAETPLEYAEKSDSDADVLETDIVDKAEEIVAEESAFSDVEEGVEAETKPSKARKLPRFLRRRNRGTSKNKDE